MTFMGATTTSLKVETYTTGEVTALRRDDMLILLAPHREIDTELLDIYDWIGTDQQMRTVGEIKLDGVSRMIQITLV